MVIHVRHCTPQGTEGQEARGNRAAWVKRGMLDKRDFGNFAPDRAEEVAKGGTGLRTRQMKRSNEPTDEGLLGRMMAGDEEAFLLLYRRKHPPIYRFALHMSGNAAVADDVTQEVFMALIRDAGRFDPARGSLGGFLFGIARNHLRKRWEQEQRFVPFADDPDEVRPAITLNGNGHGRHADNRYDDEAMARLRRAVATLPENYREALVLCDLQEMSYEEAAAALDCPVGTVRSRLHRARALLTEKLRDEKRVDRAPAVGE
jgi:RNA polymerase sigma-70 factor, ECF subfamily